MPIRKQVSITVCPTMKGRAKSGEYIIYSHDVNSAQFILQFRSESGESLDLINATPTALIVLHEEGGDRTAILNEFEIISLVDGEIGFTIPKNVIGFTGKCDMYIYLDFADGSSSDEVHVSFVIKKSLIDTAYVEAGDYYIAEFETILNEVKAAAAETVEQIEQLKPITTRDVLKVKYTLNSKVEILSRYGELYNLKRSVEPMGVNQLWQIGDMYLIEEYNNKLSTFDGGTKLFEQYTDMLSPWGGLAAVNNIDGDNTTVTNEIYTGGWHGYPNANNGTKTARQNSAKIYVDGVLMLNQAFECYAHSVTVVTEHFIQAANTKKADGTGREVLIEKISYTFTGNEIDVKLEATPIEPVTLMRYHFLQCQRVWNFHDHFFVIGDSNHRGWLTGDQDIWGGEANTPATAIEIVGPNDQITMEIDPTYDIGDNRFNQNASVWYHRSYGKLYFLPINNPTGLALGTGDRIRAHGKYKLTRLN